MDDLQSLKKIFKLSSNFIAVQQNYRKESKENILASYESLLEEKILRKRFINRAKCTAMFW